ncbi:MAG: tetratricopeptide repeat protein [Methanotrichaceae archaeon]|nr:tetratricopeptide repeat protein [Methanotrichaceae archaeon]
MVQKAARSVLMVPGFFGGLLGALIGAILAFFSFIGMTHGLAYSEGFLSPPIGGVLYILLGLLGSTGAVLATKKRQAGGWIMIACGFLGFLVGASAMSSLYWGWISWAVAGVMLIISGVMALVQDETLSRLPLLNSDRKAVRWSGYFVFVIGSLSIAILSVTIGLLVSVSEDNETKISNEFYWAGVHESTGRYDIAIESYDEIISTDPSNEDAWLRKGYALYRMGLAEDDNGTLEAALEVYDKALELNSSSSRAAYGRAEVLEALSRKKESIEDESRLNSS